jgi:hypothetical protein
VESPARNGTLSKPERDTWRLLLIHEAGLHKPEPLDVPELPARALERDQRTREFFILYVSLRLKAGSELPAPFPVRPVRDSCGSARARPPRWSRRPQLRQ